MTRNKVNIANGYEPNSNYLIDDRYSIFTQLINERITKLADAQEYLDKIKLKLSDELVKARSSKIIDMTFLTDKNEI